MRIENTISVHAAGGHTFSFDAKVTLERVVEVQWQFSSEYIYFVYWSSVTLATCAGESVQFLVSGEHGLAHGLFVLSVSVRLFLLFLWWWWRRGS